MTNSSGALLYRSDVGHFIGYGAGIAFVIPAASASIYIPDSFVANCPMWQMNGYPEFVVLIGVLDNLFPSPEGTALTTGIGFLKA
ncbi:hypothetical protein M3P05_01760 [Sansalvadorimonas sp. 2012CJ34-2]|uniref:Uncharacterized protein n=1 Tax=Parendozoicomonas callyspongiae TaxID=2942213 RepID=A0ABT0PBF0_9GAMM|nr:hypothetical protein [Sansalvadorimonas sp. 2012CJ34-2]MCL6268679.1 hypothetical protein [Sansalvadorimonas sp. 2012CJ34-2]